MKKSDIPEILRSKYPKRRGVVYIWVAVFLLLFILLIGLVLDTAKVYYVKHQLQNAADAAALGGARVIKEDTYNARVIAADIASANHADGNSVLLNLNDVSNDPNGDIVVGRYNIISSTFTATTKAPNALKVVARRTDNSLGGPISLNFGPIANVDTANVSSYAIAKASGGTGAGLIALSEDDTGLRVSGTVNLDVNQGAIQVNSEIDPPVVSNGQPGVDANEMNIVSQSEAKGDLPVELPVSYGEPAIPDPLCNESYCMDPPMWDPLNDLSPSPGEAIDVNSGTVVLQPGFYSGGLRITGGNVLLQPGIYVLDGSSTGSKSGLVIGGNANFCARGVMFYVTGDGVVDIAGSGSINITELDPNTTEFCDPAFDYPEGFDIGDYEGMAIFQARDNYNDARILGTSLMDLEGTLYFPKNHLELGGTGDGFGNQLIADTIWVHGTGDITINYDGRNKAPGSKSYLVE
ncbi:MAG: pilus assembly protein TadG-related protein [Planctomycetota bacterium]|jgi:hypothetical protein